MRDIATKTDNISTLSAAEFNSDQNELENAVTESGITLDTTTDTNLFMLAEAITRASQGAQAYQDSGTADAYALTAIGTYRQPTAYTDGMTVLFQAGNANTGASTINVSSLGVVDLVDKDGSELSSGDISADEYYVATYDETSGDFKIVLSGASAIADATTTVKGIVELATVAEAEAGTDTTRAVTPEGVAAAIGANVNEQQLAKAWVCFNGTGTPSIRDSYNVSSITDNGTGDFTINFSITMANANYAAVMAGDGTGSSTSTLKYKQTVAPTTTSLSVWHVGTIFSDPTYAAVAIFGDLA